MKNILHNQNKIFVVKIEKLRIFDPKLLTGYCLCNFSKSGVQFQTVFYK